MKNQLISITAAMVLGFSFVACETRVSRVTLNKTSLTLDLDVDSTEKLLATVHPEEAINKDIIWESSDGNVATVTADGSVSAQSPGRALITVRTQDRGRTATCMVYVPITLGMQHEQAKNLLFKGQNIPAHPIYGLDRQNSDCREAVRLFRELAKKGYAPAEYSLGNCYYGGWGVSGDMEEAVKHYRLSAEQGYAPAQYILGEFLYNGYVYYASGSGPSGVKVRNESEGQMWLSKAAAQGVTSRYGSRDFDREHPWRRGGS